MSINGDTQSLLEIDRLRAGYPGGFGLEVPRLELKAGEILGLLGPNGSGKTTLLKAGAGLLLPQSGRISLMGKDLASFHPRERGRSLAYVPQSADAPFQSSVRDVVSLGRYPHLGSLGRPQAGDLETVEWALEFCSLTDLHRREFQTLSAGERQRVLLARALAQKAPVLVLDEPVSNLDLRFQQETYERLRHLAEEEGLGILLADHHINLQGAYCHELLVLSNGRTVAQGKPGELITEELIASVFGLRMDVQTSPQGHPTCSWIVPMPTVAATSARSGEDA
jgi:iron complex transport system ATP-binding protein